MYLSKYKSLFLAFIANIRMKCRDIILSKEIRGIFEKRRLLYQMYIKHASIKQIFHLFKVGRDALTKPQRAFPFSVLLAVTYECQCNCVHCGVANYKNIEREELSLEQIKKNISELKKLGVANITLTGGEPLLRRDISDIIKYISKQGIIVTLDTNGLLLDMSTTIRLKKSGLNLLKVSIDSSHPHIHDDLRKMEGCFAKAVDGLKNSVKSKLPSVIQTYVSYNTLQRDDLRKIINLSRQLNLSGVCVQLAKASGKLKNYNFINQNINNYIKKNLDSTFVYFSNIISDFLNCSAISKKECYISAYGDVQPCMFLPLIFGNINEKKIKDIWNIMIKHPIYSMSANRCLVNDLKAKNRIGF